MDKIQKLKSAIEYAKENPNDETSLQLRKRIESGMYDKELGQIKQEKLSTQGADADKFLGKSKVGQLFSKETLKELPGEAYNVGKDIVKGIGKSIAQGVVSTAETPETIANVVSGKQKYGGKEYELPGIGKFKSFQTEAVDEISKLDPNDPEYKLKIADIMVQKGVTAPAESGANVLMAAKAPEVIKDVYKEQVKPAAEQAMAKAGELKTQAVEKAGELTSQATAKASETLGNVKEMNAARDTDKLIDTISGVKDKAARISTLEQTGAISKTGKSMGGAKETLFGGIKAEQTPRMVKMAEDVKGIVKPNATPVKNLESINKEIARVAEKEITPMLEMAGNTTPISTETPGWSKITQRLVDIEKPDIIRSDATLDKTYDLVRQRMIEQIQKQEPTVKGLWEARKGFDQMVKDQYGDVAFNSEKNTAIKRAVNDMRRTVNDMIGERVPSFKPSLDRLSNMYEARYNIAEQFQSLVDAGGWKRFKTLNPKTAKSLQWGVPTVIAGSGVLKIID